MFEPNASQTRSSDDRRLGLAARPVVAVIRVYQVAVSPWFAGSCRFVPSCSTYALEAIARHGALRGVWLAARRLARCHPLCPGGLDQVPTRDGVAPDLQGRGS